MVNKTKAQLVMTLTEDEAKTRVENFLIKPHRSKQARAGAYFLARALVSKWMYKSSDKEYWKQENRCLNTYKRDHLKELLQYKIIEALLKEELNRLRAAERRYTKKI